jgi:hypothetical protein
MKKTKPHKNKVSAAIYEMATDLYEVGVIDEQTFREFACVQRAADAMRLGDAMAKLDALELTPPSEDEIEREVQASRRARRSQHEHRDGLVAVMQASPYRDTDLLPSRAPEYSPLREVRLYTDGE